MANKMEHEVDQTEIRTYFGHSGIRCGENFVEVAHEDEAVVELAKFLEILSEIMDERLAWSQGASLET